LVLRVSLYCLIYKVQAARSQLDYSITLVTACQALFQISLKFGSHPGPNPLVANSVILSHPQALVKTFFRIFFGSRRPIRLRPRLSQVLC
ncbi:MAG: hypothetical protein PUB51_08390, partial [Oscillospiraceae bacterium]|nr:hypothetical protein [Oscillospiraceae bacterium]